MLSGSAEQRMVPLQEPATVRSPLFAPALGGQVEPLSSGCIEASWGLELSALWPASLLNKVQEPDLPATPAGGSPHWGLLV